MAAVELKTTQYSLLSALWRGGAMRATDLARDLSLDASTLTRNVEPLIKAGWVQAAVGDDRRTRVLQLTPRGRTQRQLARQAWVGAQQDLEQRLGPDTIETLHRLLDHCRDVLEAAELADSAGASQVSSPAFSPLPSPIPSQVSSPTSSSTFPSTEASAAAPARRSRSLRNGK